MNAPSLVTGDGTLGARAALTGVFPADGARRGLSSQDRDCPRCAAESDCSPGQRPCARDDGGPDPRRRARERSRSELTPITTRPSRSSARDWTQLTMFYDFSEHWRHLRTTNPIESSFATVNLRTRVTKGAGSKRRRSRWPQAARCRPRGGVPAQADRPSRVALAGGAPRDRRHRGRVAAALAPLQRPCSSSPTSSSARRFEDGVRVNAAGNDEMLDEKVAAWASSRRVIHLQHFDPGLQRCCGWLRRRYALARIPEQRIGTLVGWRPGRSGELEA